MIWFIHKTSNLLIGQWHSNLYLGHILYIWALGQISKCPFDISTKTTTTTTIKKLNILILLFFSSPLPPTWPSYVHVFPGMVPQSTIQILEGKILGVILTCPSPTLLCWIYYYVLLIFPLKYPLYLCQSLYCYSCYSAITLLWLPGISSKLLFHHDFC